MLTGCSFALNSLAMAEADVFERQGTASTGGKTLSLIPLLLHVLPHKPREQYCCLTMA
jgi:hypothetical protein